MARDPLPADEYALIRLTHHAVAGERKTAMGHRRGRAASTPECFAIGHAWTEDAAREGGTICLVCQVVRFP